MQITIKGAASSFLPPTTLDFGCGIDSSICHLSLPLFLDSLNHTQLTFLLCVCVCVCMAYKSNRQRQLL